VSHSLISTPLTTTTPKVDVTIAAAALRIVTGSRRNLDIRRSMRMSRAMKRS
jgi:hypothetical protein